MRFDHYNQLNCKSNLFRNSWCRDLRRRNIYFTWRINRINNWNLCKQFNFYQWMRFYNHHKSFSKSCLFRISWCRNLWRRNIFITWRINRNNNWNLCKQFNFNQWLRFYYHNKSFSKSCLFRNSWCNNLWRWNIFITWRKFGNNNWNLYKQFSFNQRLRFYYHNKSFSKSCLFRNSWCNNLRWRNLFITWWNNRINNWNLYKQFSFYQRLRFYYHN